MGEEGNKPFRFLSDQEFSALKAREKAAYLTMAAQELETRQRKLREQMQEMFKEQGQTRL